MKLHLPSSLRKALFALFAAATAQNAMASSMSSYVSQAVYADFGDNAGLYSVHGVNELLQELRAEEEGIFIYYNADSNIPKYNILQYKDQPLISFESRMDSGPAAAVSYNILATVEHNGVQNPTFTATKIGDSNAIHYYGIEYRKSGSTAEKAPFAEMNTFRLVPQTDFKITRLSKIVTDVSTYDFNTNRASSYQGEMWYRSGSGSMYHTGEDAQNVRWGGAYSYNVGGLMTISDSSDYANYGTIPDYRGIMDTSGSVLTTYRWWLPSDIAGTIRQQPLPFAIQAGDSGSPTWIYDQETQTYLYSGAMQSANGSTLSQARYAGEWAKNTENYFNVDIPLEGDETITVRAASEPGVGYYDPANNVKSNPYVGTVEIAGEAKPLNYVGVNSTTNTWKSLSSVKDNLDWFNYGNEFLNSDLTYADLFYTNNLVFNGKGGQKHNVVVDGNVDTGIGYARFVNTDTEGDARVSYTITAKDGESQLNTAGFVVEKNVDLIVELTGKSGTAREWRKIGEGDMYIKGTGDNHDILLNLGGSGTTYLQRTEGYAAYNVLANNGTRVVINDIGQIEKDFTFGFGGATLDMNGKSMTWNNGNGAALEGFTIHALTDEAKITNAKANSTTKLTWTQGGTQEYLGSFVDSENGGALQFIYDGGQDGRLVLHSIYTDLHREGSGITVQSGTLALQGTVTQHAPGSLGAQFSNAKLVNNDDWHYADMTTPVTVNGGTFELGNHARLTGTVTVNAGGVFVMRESVTHQYEYLEGGYEIKNTDDYRKFFGLHGDVVLQGASSAMKIEFNEKVDSNLVYGYNISGAGSLTVNPGVHGGVVTLSGDNMQHTGTKTLMRGGMLVTDVKALGNVTEESGKWHLTDSGYLVVDGAFKKESGQPLNHAEVLNFVRGDSDGILALTESTAEQFNLDSHRHLVIGAYQDHTVAYGAAGMDLNAVLYTDEDKGHTAEGFWHLGGGGGEIQVLSKLTGNNDLLLGANYAKGSVYLKNNENNFTGSIIFNGGVTLKYDDDKALGNARVRVNYTNRIVLANELDKVYTDSDGTVLVDKLGNRNLDLTKYSMLAIGSEKETSYGGTITVAENGSYNFGGSTGVLSIKSALAANGTNNLMLDAQTFSGGEIRLDAATAISGRVEVRGYDTSKAGGRPIDESGNITLGFGVNDAIKDTSSVTLMKGGYLDLHGTTQHINNLEVNAGGAVFSSASTPATLDVLLSQNVTWAGSVAAEKISITQTNGSAKLTLVGSTDYDEMRINSGVTVAMGANNTLAAMGTIYIGSGAVLQTNGHSSAGNIVVESGGIMRSEASGSRFSGFVTLQSGGSINFTDNATLTDESTLVSNGGTIVGHNVNLNGYNIIQGEAVTTLFGGSQQGGVNIGGELEIANGSTLKLREFYSDELAFAGIIIWCSYGISSADINTAERRDEEGRLLENSGKLQVHAYEMKLTGTDQEIGGILELYDDSGSSAKQTHLHASQGTKTINRMQVNTSAAFIADIYRQSQFVASGANWIIHHLDGESGDISVNLQKGNYMLIDDAGTFSKKFNMQGGTLALAHSQALRFAEVALTNGAVLALDTPEVQVRGLSSSDANACIYAGTMGSTDSTRNADLLINTDGITYTYAGKVLSDAEYGVSLTKAGEGKQEFSGAEVALRNVTVNGGTLAFTNNTSPTISGDITIAQGGTLDMKGREIILGSGQTLAITGTGDTLAALNGSLSFDGGKLQFSGSTLAQADGNAVLNLTGTSQASGLVVNFSDERSLVAGKGYQLSTGNWSGVDNIETDSMIYYTAEFVKDANGLSVTFSDRQDIQVWDGKTSESYWNGSNFGQQENLLDGAKTAVFNDTADSTGVAINADQVVKEMVFDNDAKKYALVTGGSYVVQAETIRQVGKETTELSGKIQVESATVEAGTLSLLRGSSVKEDVAVAESATLNLGVGSSVKDVQVAEGGTVVVRDYQVVTGGISGEGTIQVNWSDTEKRSLNFKSIGTLEVQSGSVDMTEQGAQMDVLHVKEGAVYSNDSQEEHYAHKAIVDEGGRLETSIGDYTTSGLVSNLEGKGTVVLVAGTNQVDLGNHAVTGGNVNALNFTGTLQLGDGENEFRFRSTNVTGLGAKATIVVEEKAQYWAGNGDATVQANMVLKGDSASSERSSWNREGFGAVRGVSNFNGSVTIVGNAMVSGTANIAFNADIKGEGDNATLTFGGYHSSEPAQTYTLAEGMKTEGLANMVVRLSGGKTTTVNVNSEEGLADNLKFESKVAGNGSVNVNASNSIQRLESAAGDGVVNIMEGKSLMIANGADFGGRLNLAQAATVTSLADSSVVKLTGGATFESTVAADAVSITGVQGTALENACINLSEDTTLKMNKVTLAGQAAITGADGARVDTSLIDLAAGTRLEMANVTFGINSTANGAATLVANELTIEAQLKPLTYADTDHSQLEEPVEVASLTLDNIQNVVIEGAGENKGLLVHLVGMSDLGNVQWLQVDLGEDGLFADSLAVTLQYEDASGQHRVLGQYTMDEVVAKAAAEEAAMNHEFVYFHLSGNVPEPATSTLSLLALAALAARRRRK